jgi:tRNA modification GTPase
MGIQRALARAKAASLVLYVEDMTQPADTQPPVEGTAIVRVGSKLDLAEGPSRRYDLSISTRSGAGIPDLLDEIGRRATEAAGDLGDVLPSRARHQQLLVSTYEHLLEALEDRELELRAEALRLASDTLGRITGAVDVEDLLDVIFSEFCIGK